MLRNKLVINEASQKSDSSDSNKSDTDTKESRYFQTIDAEDADISLKFLEIEVELKNFLKNIGYGKPVAYVYNPLEYAFQIHSEFVHKYCRGRKRILFVGMNPGPFGACQTGVPFGEVNYVKNWFRLENSVQKPKIECPERPVLGLACTRSEISGKRFWGLFERLCQTPENFFKHAFIHNYCPLAFMGRSGINLTPNKLQVRKCYFAKLFSVLSSNCFTGTRTKKSRIGLRRQLIQAHFSIESRFANCHRTVYRNQSKKHPQNTKSLQHTSFISAPSQSESCRKRKLGRKSRKVFTRQRSREIFSSSGLKKQSTISNIYIFFV